ncbi:MAG TPA: thioredoxin domain-containing protein [Dermatophilaceae bacterium]
MTSQIRTGTPVPTTRPTRSRWTAIGIPVAVLALVSVLAALVLVSRSGASGGPAQSAPPVGSTSQAPASDEARRKPADPYAKGRVDAPVVMVMWSEFQCPFCGRFARETEPALLKQFVDAGVLRIEWRDFPYLGADSQTAALAGRAAAAQGKFWAFHDVLYVTEHRVNKGDLDAAHLRDLAVKAKLDMTRYDAEMKARNGMAEIQADQSEAEALGVTGTPAFLINGEPVLGAQPTQVFVSMIEKAAAAARAGS